MFKIINYCCEIKLNFAFTEIRRKKTEKPGLLNYFSVEFNLKTFICTVLLNLLKREIEGIFSGSFTD